MKAVIWHRQSCSTSRKALAKLRDYGAEVEIYDYIAHPPAVETLKDVADAVGLDALLRRKEPIFKELGLLRPEKGGDSDDILAAMHAHPILIERPVIFCEGRIFMGRPPEAVDRFFAALKGG